jgi:hypothetical protein
MFLPAAAESSGFVTLPPGLTGPTGFPTGMRYPVAPGLPRRLDNSLAGSAYGYMLADAGGLSTHHVM